VAITITTVSPTRFLTTRIRVKADLGITTTDKDAILDQYVRDVSAAVESYCHRPFGREVLTETVAGYGENRLMLTRTPIIAVSAVVRDSEAITDYSVDNAGAGTLYREAGWGWTVPVWDGITAGGGFFDLGSPLPRQEQPDYSVSYTAGYVLPAQNVLSAKLAVLATDDSFNSTGLLFPALLKSGDVIETSGFTNAANNGRHVVTGTPTTAKIATTSALTAEAGATGRTVLTQTLPGDVELAARLAVKSIYLERQDNPNVIEKQLGPARVRLSESDLAQLRGLPAVCVGLLRPWVRVA